MENSMQRNADIKKGSWIFPVAAAAIGCAVLSLALIKLDAFDALHEFSRQHEDMELDEIILAVAATGVVAVVAWAVTLRERLRDLQEDFGKLSSKYERLARVQEDARNDSPGRKPEA